MAERAKAKAKKAPKKKDVPEGATGSRGKVAKTKAGAGHNSGKIDPKVVAMHHEKISAIETRLKSAKAKMDSIKGELRSAYAVVKQDGIVVDDFKLARELDKRDHGEVVVGYANVGEYLGAIKSDLATVSGLFADIEVLDAMNAKIAGAAAFANSEPRSNNPHKQGTDAYAEWDASWMAAANATPLKDGEGQTIN